LYSILPQKIAAKLKMNEGYVKEGVRGHVVVVKYLFIYL
jgi:hypothetical protein